MLLYKSNKIKTLSKEKTQFSESVWLLKSNIINHSSPLFDICLSKDKSNNEDVIDQIMGELKMKIRTMFCSNVEDIFVETA